MPNTRSTPVITVINLKGGVGKTHTVWSLLGACQELGFRALAVDTDTQANLTRSLAPDLGVGLDISALFHPGAEPEHDQLIRETSYQHIHLLPSSRNLSRHDISAQNQWEKSDLHLNLAEFVDSVRDKYRYIFIDCPPRLSLVSFAALCAADYVIIPLEAADWGAQGVVDVTEAVEYTRRHYNANLQLLGYLISRFKQRRHYQVSYAAKLREHFGPLAFDTVIADLARYEKSVTHGVPITLYAPASREAHIARRLFAEVARRIEAHRRGRTRRSRKDLLQASNSAA